MCQWLVGYHANVLYLIYCTCGWWFPLVEYKSSVLVRVCVLSEFYISVFYLSIKVFVCCKLLQVNTARVRYINTPTHQGAFNSHDSQPTAARIDWERSSTAAARNGGPTRQEYFTWLFKAKPYIRRHSNAACTLQVHPPTSPCPAHSQPL